ncbi:unnamed protein product [Callosobruchus maculatus]|uniref:Receptor L-domain domain-containing protein n=1 Tax=Callosobruchus maculatus TaxID=64391 RepID=A0A653CNU1_CALMS|nr:unnamed protein product [Callosobruchus maculatus]
MQVLEGNLGCTHINGSLNIYFKDDNIDGLESELLVNLGSVVSISGNLVIRRTKGIRSLSFLQKLRYIGAEITGLKGKYTKNDVSHYSNGDNAACATIQMDVDVKVKFFKTKSHNPDEPRGFKAEGIADDTINLSWLRPLHINGKLLHFVLNYNEEPDMFTVGFRNYCEHPRSDDLAGVDLDSTYFTDTDYKVSKAPISTKVEADDVQNVEAIVFDQKDVDVFWSEPTDPNGLIVSYRVMYENEDLHEQLPTIECIPKDAYFNESHMILSTSRVSCRIWQTK